MTELWERYTEFKRPSLSPNTLAREFATARRCINLYIPSTSVDDAIAIRDWIIANKPADAAKRFLTQLSACCTWAKKSDMLPDDPFEGMALEIKIPKNVTHNEEREIDPFTAEERDSILQAFENNRYTATTCHSSRFCLEQAVDRVKRLPFNGNTSVAISA